MGGLGIRSQGSALAWFSGVVFLCNMIETAVWPQGLLDACMAMIPQVGGDSTPLHSLSILPVRPPSAPSNLRSGLDLFSVWGVVS